MYSILEAVANIHRIAAFCVIAVGSFIGLAGGGETGVLALLGAVLSGVIIYGAGELIILFINLASDVRRIRETVEAKRGQGE